MTETIIVALITMASGFFGAVLGAYMNHRAAVRESKHRVREEKKTCYSKFVSSYNAFLGRVFENDFTSDNSGFPAERELWTQFQIAYASALLICDKSSIEPFRAFFVQTGKLGETRDSPGLNSAYNAAVSAMRKELSILND